MYKKALGQIDSIAFFFSFCEDDKRLFLSLFSPAAKNETRPRFADPLFAFVCRWSHFSQEKEREKDNFDIKTATRLNGMMQFRKVF